MAETHLGAHFHLRCEDCSAPFMCDATQPPSDMRVVCPNCGYRKNDLRDAQLRRGDRVLIDHWSTAGSSIRRGAVLAIRDEAANQFLTKRVVALPGETWGIRDGDLYIDDQIARKTLAELLARRILVHDNRYQPTRTPGLPPRWQSADKKALWRMAGDAFIFKPAGRQLSEDEFNWLYYTHWACTDAPRDRAEQSPIFDNDAYNQAVKRSMNWMPDIMLSCSVECEAGGRFALVAEDEPHQFKIVFDRSKRSVVLVDLESGDEVARSNERTFADAHRLDIVVALCDRQVFVAEGGQTLITHTYNRLEPCETLRPLAIGGNRGYLRAFNLRVYRDIYYLDPAGTGRRWQSEGPLPPGRIAVLGDNPPVSIDSRHSEIGVAIEQVVGEVYRPFWTN